MSSLQIKFIKNISIHNGFENAEYSGVFVMKTYKTVETKTVVGN